MLLKLSKQVNSTVKKFNEINKMVQIIWNDEKGDVEFVDDDYKDVPFNSLVSLYKSFLEGEFELDNEKFDSSRINDVLIDKIKSDNLFSIYMDGNKVKGFIILSHKGKNTIIEELCTGSEYRKTGIGRYMLKYAEFMADKCYETKKLSVKVNEKNNTAIDFYINYGFSRDDESEENFHFFSMESNLSVISKKYIFNNKREVTGRRRFKCLDCGQRFMEFEQLVKHASKYHKDLIGDEDIYKYLYEKRNPGPYICIICKKNPREWDPIKRKYNRICNSPECAKKSREEFRKNMKKVYGTDNLLTDPDRQAKMMANRSISGKFKFPDGVEIIYVGTYELDFLKYLVEKHNFDSTDVIDCPRELYIQYYDEYSEKMRWYIPDFYLPKYNLVIEIKDGSKYPQDSKRKSLLKDKAVIKADKFNYIKIVDKNYNDFESFLEANSERDFSEQKNDVKHIFMIPEQKFAF
jgi:ribosomal protein S18 acetylase RimI-like enzyme